MARKSNRKPVQKTTTEQRRASNSVSTPAIHTVSKMVEILKPWELSETNRHKTYQMMLQDDAVFSSIQSRVTSIEVSQSKSKLSYDKHSERSVWLKEFLEYSLYNMKKSLRQVGRDASEMTFNGIAPFEIVSKIENSYPEYKGLFVLDNLVYIDPLTLDKIKPFVTEDGGRNITHWRQSLAAFRDTSGKQQQVETGMTGSVEIDVRKMAVSGYSTSSSQPLGGSPFDACYDDWRSKNLIEDYLLMGIQRDLSGTPVLKVPQDLFDKAQDTSSAAYTTLSQLTEHMTNLHQGDQSFVILPSDTWSQQGTGNPLYDINFKGVEGTSKMFDLVSIIEQKKKAIYTVLGASHLITGENGGGSYNLLEGKANLAAFSSLRDNLIIDEMYNKHVIPLLLRLNNFTNEKISDIPVYVSPPPQPVSLDEWGKAVNRTARLLPAHPDVGNAILEKLGIDYRIPEDTTPEDYRSLLFEFTEPSKVGGGNSGSTQEGGQNSDTNDENAS
jgi:hypothetical protein